MEYPSIHSTVDVVDSKTLSSPFYSSDSLVSLYNLLSARHRQPFLSYFFFFLGGGGYFLSLYIAGASKDRMKEKKRELTVGENER